MIKKIRMIIKKIRILKEILEVIEVNREGDILIKARGSLLIEGEYIVMSTEGRSREDLREIKREEKKRKGERSEHTKDDIVYRA